ncbi:MAG: choice-of-anchor D domain-containing protein [Longimicrobiales bacterium]
MNTALFRRRALPALAALLTVTAAACDDDDTPTGPRVPVVTAGTQVLAFGTLDTNFGAGMAQTVTITNTGGAAVMVGPLSVAGAAAADFVLTGDVQARSLAAGASMLVSVAFDPTATGSREAAVLAPTDDQATGTVTVGLTGTGARFTYAQVDRVGIPTLNTVFNHPPQFSKKDYNVASPMADVATYTGLFETVAGAVSNADPAATAALLLPDELPVNMGAATTSFATLTGRAPADDAVDVALSVVVGPSSLHSDNVGSNDRAFLTTFPYLAAPNN